MRYLVGFVFALALEASPSSVSAQAGEESATSQPDVLEAVPASQAAAEEPALPLELDDTGVGLTPSPPRTPKGYKLERAELRVKRAKIALGVTGGATFVGLMMTAIGFSTYEPVSLSFGPEEESGGSLAVAWTGVALLTGGFFGVIAAGIVLRNGNRRLQELQEAQHGEPRRAQWDLARLRLVF